MGVWPSLLHLSFDHFGLEMMYFFYFCIFFIQPGMESQVITYNDYVKINDLHIFKTKA